MPARSAAHTKHLTNLSFPYKFVTCCTLIQGKKCYFNNSLALSHACSVNENVDITASTSHNLSTWAPWCSTCKMRAPREGNGNSQITRSKAQLADEHIIKLTTPEHTCWKYHSNTHGLSRVTQQRGWDLRVCSEKSMLGIS